MHTKENSAYQAISKQFFDQHIEESITDEQLERVLAPVLEMILTDTPHISKLWWRYAGAGAV